MSLNESAYELLASLVDRPETFGAVVHRRGHATVVDCGVASPGSPAVGLLVARASMGGLGDVELVSGEPAVAAFEGDWPHAPWPTVTVESRSPLAACLASQYAGWKVATADYFAMASGPIRAAIGREELFDHVGHRERPPVAVGVLETAALPPDDVCTALAVACGVEADRLLLLAARTASTAGGIQIVARSLETALHKLHDLGFDLARVMAGRGAAPLPPVPRKDLTAIGRTNDAILYGGRVILEVTGDDESLAEIGPRCVSAGSESYGDSFITVFERAGRDFYAIDPALFAPAMVEFVNRDTGRRQSFGRLDPDIVARSFTDSAPG